MNKLVVVAFVLVLSSAIVNGNGDAGCDCSKVGNMESNEVTGDEVKTIMGKFANCLCKKYGKDNEDLCNKCTADALDGKRPTDCLDKLPKEVGPCLEMCDKMKFEGVEEMLKTVLSILNQFLRAMPADIAMAKSCPCEAFEANAKVMGELIEKYKGPAKETCEKMKEKCMKFFEKMIKPNIKLVMPCVTDVLKKKDEFCENCQTYAIDEFGCKKEDIEKGKQCGMNVFKMMTKAKKD